MVRLRPSYSTRRDSSLRLPFPQKPENVVLAAALMDVAAVVGGGGGGALRLEELENSGRFRFPPPPAVEDLRVAALLLVVVLVELLADGAEAAGAGGAVTLTVSPVPFLEVSPVPFLGSRISSSLPMVAFSAELADAAAGLDCTIVSVVSWGALGGSLFCEVLAAGVFRSGDVMA